MKSPIGTKCFILQPRLRWPDSNQQLLAGAVRYGTQASHTFEKHLQNMYAHVRDFNQFKIGRPIKPLIHRKKYIIWGKKTFWGHMASCNRPINCHVNICPLCNICSKDALSSGGLGWNTNMRLWETPAEAPGTERQHGSMSDKGKQGPSDRGHQTLNN